MDLKDVPLIWDDNFFSKIESQKLNLQIKRLEQFSKTDEKIKSDKQLSSSELPVAIKKETVVEPLRKVNSVKIVESSCQSKSKSNYNGKTVRKLNVLPKHDARIISLNQDLVLNVTNEICVECGNMLNRAGHFPGLIACGRCAFKTCCKISMDRHYLNTHRNMLQAVTRKSHSNIRKKSVVLDKPYLCSCGFKSIYSNTLARHLALCNKVTARVC